MSKSLYYKEAQRQSINLGLPLDGRWLGTTKQFWINRVQHFNKNFNKRFVSYRKATALARNLRTPLKRPNELEGSSNEDWKREVRRLQAKARRAIKKGKKQIKQQLPQVLRQVKLTSTAPSTRARVSPLLAEIQRGRRESNFRFSQEQAESRLQSGIRRRERERNENELMFNNLLERNQFQQIINKVIATGRIRTLTPAQITLFWNNSLRTFLKMVYYIQRLNITEVI